MSAPSITTLEAMRVLNWLATAFPEHASEVTTLRNTLARAPIATTEIFDLYVASGYLEGYATAYLIPRAAHERDDPENIPFGLEFGTVMSVIERAPDAVEVLAAGQRCWIDAQSFEVFSEPAGNLSPVDWAWVQRGGGGSQSVFAPDGWVAPTISEAG